MKRYFLIFLCFFLLISCSSTVKTNTLIGVGVGETEMETLPVTADLAVSDQRARGEATGKITDISNLTKEALAKALGQYPPSVDKPDALVGLNVSTEVDGADLKVILTGYPAYYTNFRTATKTDSLLLNTLNSGAPPIIYQQQEQPQEQKKRRKTLSGVRAQLAMNSFSTGDSKNDDDIDVGMGWGIGWMSNFPITNFITFSSEANFFYRTLYNVSVSDNYGSYEQSVDEFAISVPLMLQIMPISGIPVHFAVGLQIDLPFSTELEWERTYKDGTKDSDSEDIGDDRAILDFGIVLGAGYRVLPKLGVDLRIVIGLTSPTDDSKDDSSLNQYGLGVSYFF